MSSPTIQKILDKSFRVEKAKIAQHHWPNILLCEKWVNRFDILRLCASYKHQALLLDTRIRHYVYYGKMEVLYSSGFEYSDPHRNICGLENQYIVRDQNIIPRRVLLRIVERYKAALYGWMLTYHWLHNAKFNNSLVVP